MELRYLTDDELLAHLESLRVARDGRAALDAALDELFSRLRTDAAPEDLDYVETVVAYLTSTFNLPDEEGPSSTGVREPRRPTPETDSASVALQPPSPMSDAA